MVPWCWYPHACFPRLAPFRPPAPPVPVPLQKRSNDTCTSCGGQGFVVCAWCQGSRKSLAHDFNSGPGKHNFFLNCTVCNSNGLQSCPDC